MNDGTFSQYSTNYQRYVIDIFSIVEIWNTLAQKDKFSKKYYESVKSSVLWLFNLTDSTTGRAPNIGSNDGTFFFDFGFNDYQDYRSSIQLASYLFFDNLFYKSIESNIILNFFNIQITNKNFLKQNKKSTSFDDGGFMYFYNINTYGVLRYPKFKFRPSQCDLMHIEIFFNGKPVLIDSGTYSYNTDKKWIDYFSGIISHNSIEFDGHNSMNKISRFLYNSWPSTKNMSYDIKKFSTQWEGDYKNYKNNYHKRKVILKDNYWRVVDTVDNFKDQAILRWRLSSDQYVINKNCIIIPDGKITINQIDCNIKKIEINDAWNSNYYGEKKLIKVIEVTINKSGSIETLIELGI